MPENNIASGPCYRPILVCGEWLPNPSQGYQAYSTGQHWNGWACPHFTFEAAKKLALDMHGLQYDSEKDEFVCADPEELVGPSEERFPASVIDIDGVATKVYAIGAWSWTWEPAEQSLETAN